MPTAKPAPNRPREAARRKIVIKPNAGPQFDFLASEADIAIYGGAAGGGKTYGMLLDPLKRREVPGYDAMIFRRIGAQITLPGGLWTSSVKLYPYCGGTGFPGKRVWVWENGFSVSFRHLEDEAALGALQGAQIPFIGFDELTHFTRDQFIYMLSRNRSMTGLPGRMRATCNADATSWVKDFIRWWLDEEGQFPDPQKSGKVRWMARDGDELLWYATREEAEAAHGPNSATSVTFIPARVTDNEPLLRADPGYLTKLRALGYVQRSRLELGDWKVKEAAGTMFKREWFPIIPASPAKGPVIRYWDRAATPGSKGDGLMTGPDWTSGVRMRKVPGGRYVIEDVRRLRATPAGVEEAIKRTAEQDGKEITVGIEQDPGQAGKAEAAYHVRNLPGYNVRVFPVSKSKVTRATPFSAQCEAGNVSLVAGPWNNDFLTVLEAFPDGAHDDDVDAGSGAFNALNSGFTWGDETETDSGEEYESERSCDG